MAGNITDKRFRLLLQNAEHLADMEVNLPSMNENYAYSSEIALLLAYKSEGDQGKFHCRVASMISDLLLHPLPI